MDAEGTILGVVAAVSMSAYAVMCYLASLRKKDVSMQGALAMGGLFSSVYVLLVTGGDVGVSQNQFLWLSMQGLVSLPLWQSTLTLSTRFILPIEVNMIMLIETVLGPVL